jgi:glycosyltransferase involved in cell wall biosynthesis
MSTTNKKILVITYYWPPSGGSGVQRWLKFVKYLASFGWETYVYTPENPSFTLQDQSLLKDVPASTEVIKLPIWEPYHLFFKIIQRGGGKPLKPSDFISTRKKTITQRLSSWIRGNFFIPDARVFWVKPSVAFLSEYIASNGINKIVTTGPPHSIHLIGLGLKTRNTTLHWVADFRDPWSEWDLLDTLSLSSLARKRHQQLERKVLTRADRVVTIAPYHVQRLQALSNRKVDLITNGFDEDDFEKLERRKTAIFTIRHVGVVDQLRDPRPFMQALKLLLSQQPELRSQLLVEFIGNVNSLFKDEILQDAELKNVTRFTNYLPHDQLLETYAHTDLQLLVLAHTSIAPGNLPGKFFEYLASGNRILAVGPVEGDAADVLRETGAGEIFSAEDVEGMSAEILSSFNAWRDNAISGQRDVSMYTRKALAKQLESLLLSLELGEMV